MLRSGIAFASALSLCLGASAFAQTVSSENQRNIDQQQRIDQGLQSGQLSTGEASKLENGEARIDGMESNALKNGNLSAGEKRDIQRAQNNESRRIYALKHNGTTGNPNSASSQRMQADVQRNINQGRRIQQGINSGSLSRRDVGQLQGGQAHVARLEGKAGADGYVGPREQRHIQHAHNVQSQKIFAEKHE